jgi:predicted GTPase
MSLDAATLDALRILRRNLPAAAQHLQMEADPATDAWIQVLDLKLLPRLQADAPLIAAICGGGSAGKSTLFNALVGRAISPAGGRAGLNRRVLAAVNETLQRDPAFFAFLQHALGGELQPLEQTGQLLEPGAPLSWSDPDLPGHLVLLDTPDIDTGARGEYTNRRQARQSLEAADLFIYIFTNATYNNRDNTDFMAGLLNAVGSRPCLRFDRQ